jgi:hypothetical protein
MSSEKKTKKNKIKKIKTLSLSLSLSLCFDMSSRADKKAGYYGRPR